MTNVRRSPPHAPLVAVSPPTTAAPELDGVTLDPKYHPEGKVPIPGALETTVATDEEEEARGVADRIEALLRNGHSDVEGPITHESCAVLGRNRYVFQALERELTSRGLRYLKRLSTAAQQSESDLVIDWELALRLIANPGDRLHLGLLANRWSITQTADTLLDGGPDGLTLIQRCREKTSAPAAPHIITALRATDWSLPSLRRDRSSDVLDDAATTLDDEARALVTADLAAWRAHWNIYVRASTNRSLSEFFAQVALGATQAPRDQGISLLTVHSAKGTEFDVVFVIGLGEGTFPDYRANTQEKMNEEDRNAFVAVTRSRRLLPLVPSPQDDAVGRHESAESVSVFPHDFGVARADDDGELTLQPHGPDQPRLIPSVYCRVM